MAVEEESGGGVPEWVVTFGDMMSLLLTFFIMLVSLSEIKEEEKYQALVESMTRRFGYDMSQLSMSPGTAKPRNAMIAKLATAGRAKRLDTMRGGDKTKAPQGDHPQVRIVRPGSRTAIGTVLTFPEYGAELLPQHQEDLRKEVESMKGKPQKIEIRGHTSLRPVDPATGFADNWDLAYRRCRATFAFLTGELGIEPKRIRMSVAGPNEPLYISTDPKRLLQNPRVDVFMLDEVVDDLSGTQGEQDERFIENQPEKQ